MDARRPARAWRPARQRRGAREGVRSFVDSNVLVYLFDAGHPAKQHRARELVGELCRGGSLVLSSQVLSEFYVTVTRKLDQPLAPDVARQALGDLAAYPCVAIDAALVQRAAARSAADQLSHRDALIVEAAVEAGADVLVSEDFQAGRTYSGVRVEDPFAS
jgi:predicted nucleic acid-binding protein